MVDDHGCSNAAVDKTQCQDEFRSLSGSVTEILTACRMLQISIAWCQIDAEIRGFPTMYTMGGVNIVKIGEKHDFVQILGLKTPISVDRNFEHLTSEGSVAQNFEMSSSLTSSLQNVDIDSRNKLWGALVASKMFGFTSSYIFLHCGHPKTQKNVFFRISHNY